MNFLEHELLFAELGRYIVEHTPIKDFDYEKITEQRAIKILNEIQAVLHKHEELSDFDIVDAIVDIFVKYNLDIGGCHDW